MSNVYPFSSTVYVVQNSVYNAIELVTRSKAKKVLKTWASSLLAIRSDLKRHHEIARKLARNKATMKTRHKLLLKPFFELPDDL